MLQVRTVPSGIRVPNFQPADCAIMIVWANQLPRSSGPSMPSVKSFCALIWSSQLIGGIRRSAPMPAVLKASVTSASARSPAPEVTLPSRMAYQRPISSSRALSWATRLRSFSRAAKAGYRQAANLTSCASPHRMIRNLSAESMVSSSPASPPSCRGCRRYFRRFGASAQHLKTRPAHGSPGRALLQTAGKRRARRASLRLQSRRLHHLRPFLDVLAQIGVELGRRHDERNRALLVPGFLHVGAADRLVDLGVELIDDRLRRAGRRHDAEPDRRFVARHAGLGDGGRSEEHTSE